MKTSLDLEDDIMKCWNIVSELNVLAEEVCEGDLTKDDVANILIGLNKLYEIKFEKMFRTFEKLLNESNKEKYVL